VWGNVLVIAALLIAAAWAIGKLGDRNDDEAGREEAKAAADAAACRQDLQCYGDKAVIGAGVYCKSQVERQAAHAMRWTDGMLEQKFSRFRWLDERAGTLTMIGDKAEFQNGFGAWTPVIYFCDFNPLNNEVLDVRVVEGRL
jgi:hypothetical protein